MSNRIGHVRFQTGHQRPATNKEGNTVNHIFSLGPPGYSCALPVSREKDIAGFVPNEASLGRRDLRRVPRTLGKVERPVDCT